MFKRRTPLGLSAFYKYKEKYGQRYDAREEQNQ